VTGATWRGSLSTGQLFWLLFVLMFPTMILLPPGDLVRSGGRWAWLTPLAVAAPMAVLCGWVGNTAAQRGDWVTVARRRLGPIAGRATLALACLAVAFYNVVVHGEFLELSIRAFVLADVDKVPLELTGAVVTIYIALQRPVVMARTASILGPVVVILVLGAVLFWFPGIRLVLALPFLPTDAAFLNRDGLLLMATWLCEPMLGALLIQRVSGPARKAAGRTFAAAVALAGLVTSLATWTLVAIAGAQHGAALSIPFLSMLESVQAGFFPLHLETVVLPVLQMAGAVKAAIFVWFTARLAHGVVPIPLPWLIVAFSLRCRPPSRPRLS
jgi:hypothetical protein